MRVLFGIAAAVAILWLVGVASVSAYSGQGTSCNDSLPCPRWVGVTVNAPGGADWTVQCPGGPYSCNNISGTGTYDIPQWQCPNGGCAGAGGYGVSGSLAGYDCNGSSQNVDDYTQSNFGAPHFEDVQLTLSCTPSATPTPVPGVTPIGFFDITDCSAAWGWAFDADYAGSGTVYIYANGPAGAGGTLVGSTTANGSRPDVGSAYPGRTNSGWSWLIPGTLKDGIPHALYAYAINVNSAGTPGGGNPLLPVPRTITCFNPPSGTFSSAVCGSASGSATDPQGSPVNVRIYDGPSGGGGLIGTGPAGPNFTIGFPQFTNGQIHTLYAYAQDIPTATWYQLTNTQAVACTPTVTLNAAPATVAYNGSTTLNWSVSNAGTCIASPAGWFIPGTVVNGVGAGAASSGALTATTTFTLTCTNAAMQSAMASRVVTVNPPPPTVSLSANPVSVFSGATSVLTWSSTDAVSCSASNGWSGVKGTSGTETTASLTTPTTFTLTCTNATGSGAASTTVGISVPLPIVTLSANPTSVLNGATSVLTWSSTDAVSCSASSAPDPALWTGLKSASGNETTAPLTTPATFTLTCINTSGSASASAAVGASPPFPKYREVRPGSQPTPTP